MAPRFSPNLEFARHAPPGAEICCRGVARRHGGPADVIVCHAAVHLKAATDLLNEAHARVLAIDALECKLFAGMLRAQLRTAELDAGPKARLGEAGLQRDVGRIRELTADVHVTRADCQRAVEQAVTRLCRCRESSRIAPLRVGDFAADVERAETEQTHIPTDEPVRIDRLLGADSGYPDPHRVQTELVSQELAYIQRSAGAGHEALFRCARPLERHHDEHRIAVSVGRRNRLFEQHNAAGIIDLIIHEADEGLGRHSALGIGAIACLDSEVFRAGYDIGRKLIRSGDARAANLELAQRLRCQASEGAPGDRARRHARRQARHCAPVLCQAQAAAETARRYIAERGPVVPALEPCREPRLRRGPLLLRARVPQDRILGLFQRIGAAVEDVPPIIQAARVETHGE